MLEQGARGPGTTSGPIHPLTVGHLLAPQLHLEPQAWQITKPMQVNYSPPTATRATLAYHFQVHVLAPDSVSAFISSMIMWRCFISVWLQCFTSSAGSLKTRLWIEGRVVGPPACAMGSASRSSKGLDLGAGEDKREGFWICQCTLGKPIEIQKGF